MAIKALSIIFALVVLGSSAINYVFSDCGKYFHIIRYMWICTYVPLSQKAKWLRLLTPILRLPNSYDILQLPEKNWLTHFKSPKIDILLVLSIVSNILEDFLDAIASPSS